MRSQLIALRAIGAWAPRPPRLSVSSDALRASRTQRRHRSTRTQDDRKRVWRELAPAVAPSSACCGRVRQRCGAGRRGGTAHAARTIAAISSGVEHTPCGAGSTGELFVLRRARHTVTDPMPTGRSHRAAASAWWPRSESAPLRGPGTRHTAHRARAPAASTRLRVLRPEASASISRVRVSGPKLRVRESCLAPRCGCDGDGDVRRDVPEKRRELAKRESLLSACVRVRATSDGIWTYYLARHEGDSMARRLRGEPRGTTSA